MNYFSTNKALYWIIGLLLIANLALVATILYHMNHKDFYGPGYGREFHEPGEKMGRYFMEELQLNENQHDRFRELRMDFHHRAGDITDSIWQTQRLLVKEIGRENPDTLLIGRLTDRIGRYHTQLKRLTVSYYFDLKEICDPWQQEKLQHLFEALTAPTGKPGYRGGGKRKGKYMFN